jgi:hypothetical protein
MNIFLRFLKSNILIIIFFNFLFGVNPIAKSEDRYGDYKKHRYLKYADQPGLIIMDLVDNSEKFIYIPKENTPKCKKEDIFGYVSSSTGVFGICTYTILNYGDTFEEDKFEINATIRHEAVHSAQFCKNPTALRPLGVSRRKLEGYPANQVLPEDSYYSKAGYSYIEKIAEMEGFYGEFEPYFVIEALNKNCY